MTYVLGDAAPWAVRQVGSLTLVAADPLGAEGQSPWWPAVLVASVPLAGVVFVAIFNARATRKNQRQIDKSTEALDRLRAGLTEEHEEASAERTYKFEAKKRLYTELGPLLFQLQEQSESALFRIHGLAKSARNGQLAPESDEKGKNRLNKESRSYLPSTLYRFMAPLATYHLCQQRLTTVDLSVDDELQRHYLLAKMLYRSWTDGAELAEIGVGGGTPLRYEPGRKHHDPSISARQHLNLQKIERIIESMIVEPDHENRPRCVTLGEFFRTYAAPESTFRDAVEPLRDLFIDFHPGSRPVLWRLLIVHAYLYQGLNGHALTPEESFESVFGDEDRHHLYWTDSEPGSIDQAKLDEPFVAARAYLTSQIAWRAVTEVESTLGMNKDSVRRVVRPVDASS
jgi:hypothetical protein